MAGDRKKPRLLSMLRRTTRSAEGTPRPSSEAEGAVWLAHERALLRARESSEAAQRLATSIARQRGAVDVSTDRMRVVASRAQEVQGGFARVVDAFERLALVALNAGLEGARLGEAQGRALLLVGDEVRAHATRGSDTARELAVGLGELAAEMGQLHVQLGQARDTSAESAQEAARTAGTSAEVEKSLEELTGSLRKATGTDPDTVRLMTEAGEHARALVAALGSARPKVPRGLLLGTMRPVLEPLVRLLAEDSDDEDEVKG